MSEKRFFGFWEFGTWVRSQIQTLTDYLNLELSEVDQTLQSKADQSALNTKLNASDYTAGDVLAKLLTVDGPNSGLNADVLDGKQLATIEAEYKAFTSEAVAALVDSSPDALNTLNELSAALGDDPNFATTITNQLASKVDMTDTRLTDAREWSAITITQSEAETGVATTRRAWTAQRVRQAIAAWWTGSADKTKLDGIAAGATANSTDATLLNRSNHTGTQSISTVSGLQTALDNKLGSAAQATDSAKLEGSTKAQVITDARSGLATTAQVAAKLDATANAVSASKLQTARTIGGVAFDGTANINLPGVNAAGNQSTSGNAATATKLQTARTINGVAFDGSADITIADSTKLPLAGGNMTGDLVYQNVGVGGWARGLTAKIQSSGAIAAGIGFLGNSDAFNAAYLGIGSSPWNSGNGVRVTAAGVTISGATTFDTLINGSVSGNAATSNRAGVLNWTNYGGGQGVGNGSHVIFDASNSVSPSGKAVNNTNPEVAWSPTLPTLMGWNGSQTYGLRVDSARVADGTPWTGVSGKPTTLAGYGITNGYALDGVNSGWFRSSGAQGWFNETYAGGIYMTDATYVRVYNDKAFYCAGNEIVLEGSSPTMRFYDNNWGNRYIHCNDSLIGFLSAGFGWTFRVDNDGNAIATGNVTAYSDIRLKTDIELIPDALNKVLALRGVTYERIDSGERQTGVIAQEVQAVLPEAVMTMADEQQTLSVAYGNLVGLLIEAIKELKAEVEELKLKVAD